MANNDLCLFVELISTGGTAATLRKAGLTVIDVADYTAFPEILDGRVKTLHPKIHGALLAVRGNESHEASMKEHGITSIDMVVANLYPFSETVAAGKSFDLCIENIDIGGPSMIRSAAKNHRAVAVVTSPQQYDQVVGAMSGNDGAVNYELRKSLAAAAFRATAAYDTAIDQWFQRQNS